MRENLGAIFATLFALALVLILFEVHGWPARPVADVTPAPTPHDVEYGKWIDERDAFSRRCFEQNGVPVFTFGMRLFCVSRSALVGGGARGEPDRPCP